MTVLQDYNNTGDAGSVSNASNAGDTDNTVDAGDPVTASQDYNEANDVPSANERVIAEHPQDEALEQYKAPEGLQQLWAQAQAVDNQYQLLVEAVRENRQSAPVELRHLKLSMSDLKLQGDQFLWRSRFWVPKSEPLWTGILQETHDSVLTGHPGKEGMTDILVWRYFWPGMSRAVAILWKKYRLAVKKARLATLPIDRRENLI